METEWREIPGFPGYEVSDDGQVRSFANNRWGLKADSKLIVAQRGHKDEPTSHLQVGLRKSSRRYSKKIHTLVLEAFVGPRPEGMQGCHNNGNPLDNRRENLRWDTPKGNMADKKLHGTEQTGDRHWMARTDVRPGKLTVDDVLEIRLLRAQGLKLKEISERFDVTETNVSYIVRRITWGHI